MTISLPSARSLHNTDVRDSFLTVQAACSKEKMCVMASLPLRLSARSLRRKDVRDSFLTVQGLCDQSLHTKEVRDNFLRVQAMRSKFTQKR